MENIDELPILNRHIYRISNRPVKVLQFGEGNFLRAFVDWIINRMNMELDFDAGVHIVQPIEKGMCPVIDEQHGLYTVNLRGMDKGEPKNEFELVDCIQGTISPYSDYERFMNEAVNPDLRFIVSNTTEAGIRFDPSNEFKDEPPKSFPAKLTQLLWKRFDHFKGDPRKALILLPCEVIDRNGDTLREYVLRYGKQWALGKGFSDWVLQHCLFCNTLVDRMVPGYPKSSEEDLWCSLGYRDKLMVVAEYYHLWVIEAPEWLREEFPAHEAGMNVLITNDLGPWRNRKVRILNGAHTSLVPVAYLTGMRTVSEAMKNEWTGRFVSRVLEEEIIPVLDMPRVQMEEYGKEVLNRFDNPLIEYKLINIALNSISKFKIRVLPSLLEYQKQKKRLPLKLVFAFASLIRFYRGDTPEGDDIRLQDEGIWLEAFSTQWDRVDQGKNTLRMMVDEILSWDSAWGKDLREVPGLSEQLADYLGKIETEGILESLKKLLS